MSNLVNRAEGLLDKLKGAEQAILEVKPPMGLGAAWEKIKRPLADNVKNVRDLVSLVGDLARKVESMSNE